MGALPAGVTITADELVDLCLEGGPYERRAPGSRYLVHDVPQLTTGVEELVELATEALAGGYSSDAGIGYLLRPASSRRAYARVAFTPSGYATQEGRRIRIAD